MSGMQTSLWHDEDAMAVLPEEAQRDIRNLRHEIAEFETKKVRIHADVCAAHTAKTGVCPFCVQIGTRQARIDAMSAEYRK